MLAVADQFMRRRVEVIMRLVNKQWLLNVPLRRRRDVVFISEHVAVFDDAAYLHVRQAEDLAHDAPVAALEQQLVYRLSGKRNDGPVRMDRATLDGADGKRPAFVRNFYVRIFLPFFGKDFDPRIERMEMQLVVRCFLPEQIHRIRTWGRRIGGHAEFFPRGLLKIRSGCREKGDGSE